jgi:hypothetical protein
MILPVAVSINTVPRYAGGIFDNADIFAAKGIKQGGFSYVRPSHDGNDGFLHDGSPDI